MNNLRLIIFAFITLLCASSIYAFGSRDRGAPETKAAVHPAQEVKTVQVTGVVRLVGSSVMREIVISGGEAEWYAARDEMDKLHNLQHQTVTVEGTETVMELTFASGISAGVRRELSNIKIISVELNGQ